MKRLEFQINPLESQQLFENNHWWTVKVLDQYVILQVTKATDVSEQSLAFKALQFQFKQATFSVLIR